MKTALAIRDESSLDDEQFAVVLQASRAPLPADAYADDALVRDLIASLAGVLKQARTSIEGGKFKLGLFRKALVGHVTAGALRHACDRALRECEWMPTPAELIRLAQGFVRPDVAARDQARQLVTDRRSRFRRATFAQLRERAIAPDDLPDLPEDLIADAVEARLLMWTLDAEIVYPTPENVERDARARRAFTANLFKAPAQ